MSFDATATKVVSTAKLQLTGLSAQQTSLTGGAVDSYFFPITTKTRQFARANVPLAIQGCPTLDSTFSVTLNSDENAKAFNAIGKVTIESEWPAIRHECEKPREYRRPHKHACQDNYSFMSGSSACSSTSKSCGKQACKTCSSKTVSDSCSSSSSSSGSSGCSDSTSSSGCSTKSSKSSKSGCDEMPRDKFVYYSNSVGNWAIKSVTMMVDAYAGPQNWGEHLELLDEVVEGWGKDSDETVGRFEHEQDLWRASRECNVRTARLSFFFTQEIQKVLPIYRIVETKISLSITTRTLDECFYSKDRSHPYRMDSENRLAASDIKFAVHADVFWFTPEQMADVQNDSYLIQEYQKIVHPICCISDDTNVPVVVDLSFHNMVQGMSYFIQAEHHIKNKDWLNYSGRKGRDPMSKNQLLINGMDASTPESARAARVTSALNTLGINVPTRTIYGTWWSLTPTSGSSYTGGLDFDADFLKDSKAKIQLKLWLQRNLGKATFNAYAMSYNAFNMIGSRAEIGFRQTPA